MINHRSLFFLLLIGLILIPLLFSACQSGSNKSNKLGSDYYYTYQFDQKPSLGTSILKVQVYGNDGKKSAPFKITGSVSMPSMGTDHDSGEQVFRMNKKGDYLLPVDLVMQGSWEITLIFYKGESEYARSKITIDI
ncbi:MAG: hypothetical protein V1843_03930 [bacterium]